jgi:hypothetical protein
MALESLRKLAQDALDTAKDVAEKAAAGVRSVAPETFDSAVKTVTETATSAVDTVRETKVGQTIIEGANSLAENAAAAGGRIARAAEAATEAFMAEDPKKDEVKDVGKVDDKPAV